MSTTTDQPLETIALACGHTRDVHPAAYDLVTNGSTDRIWCTGCSALRTVAAPNVAMRPKYVYVASSWRNELQDRIVHMLQSAGIDCYDFKNPDGRDGFSWSEIDPDWQQWTAQQYVAALQHPAAVAGFTSDFEAMQRADTFVLVLPCGRSAHLELGWATGRGKRTCVLTRDGEEPELMAKMVDHIATSEADLLDWLGVGHIAELWQVKR